MTSIYIWVRSIRSLQYFLPNSSSDTDTFDNYFALCLKIIQNWGNNSNKEEEKEISFPTFLELCDGTISETYAEAIHQNAKTEKMINPEVKDIVYSTILATIQQNPNSKKDESRSNLILLRTKKHFYNIFKLLFYLNKGFILEDKDISLNIFNHEEFEFLDELFEGTVKVRCGIASNKSSVRPLSQLVPIIFEQFNGSYSTTSLCNTIRNLLILDPYHIDEIPFDKISPPGLSSFRRTTLAHNSRRVVHLQNINKIELLRKDEFADIHLRICNDKSKASFIFAPLKTESVILDNLTHCQAVVLGAVHGNVILRNCHNFQLSVCCDILIVIDCARLNINSMSKKKPLILNCEDLSFGPFNTTYEGHVQFLTEYGCSYEENKNMKEPINLGNSSWKFVDPSKFFCSHTPIHTTDADIDILVACLPDIYKKYTHRNTREAQRRLEIENLRISDVLSNRDLIYLKSKIEKNIETDKLGEE